LPHQLQTFRQTHAQTIADFRKFEGDLVTQELEQQRLNNRINELEKQTSLLQGEPLTANDLSDDRNLLVSSCMRLNKELASMQTGLQRLSGSVWKVTTEATEDLEDVGPELDVTLNVYLNKVSELMWRLEVMEQEIERN
jgi:hypothetical protein